MYLLIMNLNNSTELYGDVFKYQVVDKIIVCTTNTDAIKVIVICSFKNIKDLIIIECFETI